MNDRLVKKSTTKDSTTPRQMHHKSSLILQQQYLGYNKKPRIYCSLHCIYKKFHPIFHCLISNTFLINYTGLKRINKKLTVEHRILNSTKDLLKYTISTAITIQLKRRIKVPVLKLENMILFSSLLILLPFKIYKYQSQIH